MRKLSRAERLVGVLSIVIVATIMIAAVGTFTKIKFRPDDSVAIYVDGSDVLQAVDSTGGVSPLRTASGMAPVDSQYVTMAADATLTNERILAGTTNQIVVTDGGAGAAVTLSTPQDLHSGASPTFGGMALNGDLDMNGNTLIDVLSLAAPGDVFSLYDSSGFKFFAKSGSISGGASIYTLGDVQIQGNGTALYVNDLTGLITIFDGSTVTHSIDSNTGNNLVKGTMKIGDMNAALGQLHVLTGLSGSISSTGTNYDIVATIEGSATGGSLDTVVLQLFSPATKKEAILFGQPSDHDAGRIIYDHNTNSLLLYTANAEAFLINSSQNVLTTAGLSVNNSNVTGGDFTWDDDAGAVFVLDANSSSYIDMQTGRDFEFRAQDSLIVDGAIAAEDAGGIGLVDDAGNAGLWVEDGGQVGIGHTVPLSKLHLKNTGVDSITQISIENDGRRYAFGVHGGLSDAFTIYDVEGAGTRFYLNTDGSIQLTEVYNDTVTSSRDLEIQSDGQIGYVSSKLVDKTDVEEVTTGTVTGWMNHARVNKYARRKDGSRELGLIIDQVVLIPSENPGVELPEDLISYEGYWTTKTLTADDGTTQVINDQYITTDQPASWRMRPTVVSLLQANKEKTHEIIALRRRVKQVEAENRKFKNAGTRASSFQDFQSRLTD